MKEKEGNRGDQTSLDQEELLIFEARRDRVCRKCNNAKPERTHHCSMCQRCVVRFDHHCPWVNNCVGAGNYKSFVLFLLYTHLSCLTAVCALAPWVFHMFTHGDEDPQNMFAVFFSTVIDFAMGLAVLGLLAMHISLVLRNCTTLESLEEGSIIPTPPKKKNKNREKKKKGYFHDRTNWRFFLLFFFFTFVLGCCLLLLIAEPIAGTRWDLGRRANVEQIFGSDWRLALLPIKTVPMFVLFPLREDAPRDEEAGHPDAPIRYDDDSDAVQNVRLAASTRARPDNWNLLEPDFETDNDNDV
jgi:hypothetical protein